MSGIALYTYFGFNSHLQRSHYKGTESDSCKLDCVCDGWFYPAALISATPSLYLHTIRVIELACFVMGSELGQIRQRLEACFM